MHLKVFITHSLDLTLYLNCFFSTDTGEQVLQTGGEGLEDSAVLDDEDMSPQPQGRRNRREACTCPMCKDGEPRYVTQLRNKNVLNHTTPLQHVLFDYS